MQQLQIKQNRALKTLYELDFLTPTKQMHKDLKLLMVKDIAKINTLKFVYNQRNEITPAVFKKYFIENRNIHTHNTRQTENLHNLQTNSNREKQLIKYRGAILWNEIPLPERKHKTIKTFSKHVRERLINSY